ncbi:MAG TPA: flagellar biosynthetic protein FliO [Pedococcus sp.]|nr:flagellar biosynthetic protein FliO [Pedococcus sp.]
MSDGSTVVAVLRLLVSLGAVLTLVVWVARYAAKRGIGGARTPRGGVSVDVLSRRSLGRTSSVQVVQVGRRTMVLGVTEHGVSVLGELGEEDLVVPEPVAAQRQVEVPGRHAFEQLLAAQAAQAAGGPLAAGAVDGPFAAPGFGAPVAARVAAPAVVATSRPHGVASRIPVPDGWPWSAASFVLRTLQARRG